MEQQAQLRDGSYHSIYVILIVQRCLLKHHEFLILSNLYVALNDALKKEVERLRIATGEMMSPFESFNLGMHQMPYNQPTPYFPLQQQSGPAGQKVQLPLFSYSTDNMSTNHLHQSNSHPFSEMLQNGPVGQFQGLDISNEAPSVPVVKSEGPSLSANESSTTI